MIISIAIIKNTLSETLTYRLNFLLWRFRMVTRFLIAYFIWSSILTGQSNVRGYTLPSMLTYLISSYVLAALIISTRTQDVGDEINNGNLSNALLRPQSYLSFLISRDIADKSVNLVCSLIEAVLLILLLHPPLIMPTHLLSLFLSLLAVAGAIVLYFLISLLMSMVGFWTNEVWAIRFSFFILLDFFMGVIIPPDMFPDVISRVLFFTPFPYLLFFPTKLYLETLPVDHIAQGFLVLGIWTAIVAGVVWWVWKMGLKKYSAEGR